MDDADAGLEQLRKELQDVSHAFWDEFHRAVSSWQIAIGPIHIGRPVGSMFVTKIYILFNGICFAAGVAFAVLGGILGSLGVALVVGALFSFGAFVAQFWMVVQQREREMFDRLFGDRAYAKLEHLAKKRMDLSYRIERLNEHQSQHPAGDSPGPEPAD